MHVLDTNTVSFLMRGDVEVVARLIEMDRTQVRLPQPVIAEIEYGLGAAAAVGPSGTSAAPIRRSRRRADPCGVVGCGKPVVW